MKTVVFRADSSNRIGTGHAMRCMTLAQVLRERGMTCRFICQPLPGNANGLIRAQGFDVIEVPDLSAAAARQLIEPMRAEWVVVDHYGLDEAWETAAIPSFCRCLVIDDLADRPHRCDILLDQNLGRDAEDYGGLVAPGTDLLIGPRHALLRSDFAQHRASSLSRRAPPRAEHLLINFGGSDPNGATEKVLHALAGILGNWKQVTVVMGQKSPHLAEVLRVAAELGDPVEVLVQVHDMAHLMAEADVAIGAAGSTSWERCCLGLPSGLVVIAENQSGVAAGLATAGAAVVLADLTRSDALEGVAAFLHRAQSDAGLLAKLSARSSALVDGLGAARVADMMTGGKSR